MEENGAKDKAGRNKEDVRTEIKRHVPQKIKMSLLKMISPVIIRTACVPRVVNLLPSIPNPGALGVSV